VRLRQAASSLGRDVRGSHNAGEPLRGKGSHGLAPRGRIAAAMKRWHAYVVIFAGALVLLWSARSSAPRPATVNDSDGIERSESLAADPERASSASSSVREERRAQFAGPGGAGDDRGPACERDDQCDRSMHCNDAGECVGDLQNGASCTRASMCEGERCGRGVCCSGKECCRDGADCLTRYVCRDVAACLGEAIDRRCRDNACEEIGARDDNQGCVGQVARTCGSYRDVKCELHQPPGSCKEACRDASDCRPGNTCLGGECRFGCQSDSECDRDHTCMNGFCMRDCSEARPCAPSFVCTPFVDRGSGIERSVSVCVDL
jgi:hypothetical protein